MSDTAMAPVSRLLRMAEVRTRTCLSPATIYRWLKDKRFPEPIRYSDTCVRWREADIEAWIAGHAPPPVAVEADGAH